jgi:ankyrin repeat protein
MYAAENRCSAVLHILLSQPGIDVNLQEDSGCTAVMMTIEADRRWGFLYILLDQRHDIKVNLRDKGGYTALMFASSHRHTHFVDALLEQHDTQINLQANDGYAALMCAAKVGDVEVARVLLEKIGIDSHLKNSEGHTALSIAHREGHCESLSYFLEKHMQQSNDNSSGIPAAPDLRVRQTEISPTEPEIPRFQRMVH